VNGVDDRRVLLGRRVRALRVWRGWRQEDLALACGMQRSYIGGVERGERNIGFDNLLRLADALDVPVKELFSFSASIESDRPNPGERHLH